MGAEHLDPYDTIAHMEEGIPAGEAIFLWTEQIRTAIHHNLYMVALLSALELPSMISGLLAEDGQSTGRLYSGFLVRVGRFTEDYADRLWRFRCSLAHQGRLLPHKNTLPYGFVEPGAGVQFQGLITLQPSGRQFEAVNVIGLVLHLCDIAEEWSIEEGGLPIVQRNLTHFVRRHEDGAPPNIQGVPMIF